MQHLVEPLDKSDSYAVRRLCKGTLEPVPYRHIALYGAALGDMRCTLCGKVNGKYMLEGLA